MKISKRLRKAAEASDDDLDDHFYGDCIDDDEAECFVYDLMGNAYDFDSADERRLSLLFAAAVAEGEGL